MVAASPVSPHSLMCVCDVTEQTAMSDPCHHHHLRKWSIHDRIDQYTELRNLRYSIASSFSGGRGLCRSNVFILLQSGSFDNVDLLLQHQFIL